MALPPLPEIFGNYTLRGFVEVEGPDAISWVPTAPGWRVVLALLLLGLAWWGWQRGKYWWRNRYRRYAVEELRAILSAENTTATKLGQISALLKATALQAYRRSDIAALSGASWIDWLNEGVPVPVFGEEHRALLTVEVYRAQPQLEPEQLLQLGSAVERWIGSHREPTHD